MGKRLFLLLFSAFIGIFGAPEILMASDSFNSTGLNNAGIAETVPIVVEEPAAEVVGQQKVELLFAQDGAECIQTVVL